MFCPFTSGVPLHSVVAQPHGVRGAGCAWLRNLTSCSETPPPTGGLAWGHSRSGSFMSCSSSWPGREVFNLATRVRVPHTAPAKSRERSRSATKPAATIGRLRNPSPEPFCICFVSSEEEHSPVQRGVAGSSPARGAKSRALGGGRSSMAEPRVVGPLTSVRSRSATPKRIRFILNENHHEARIRRRLQLLRRPRPASAVTATRPKRESSAAIASSTATRNCARSSVATIRACADRRGCSRSAA